MFSSNISESLSDAALLLLSKGQHEPRSMWASHPILLKASKEHTNVVEAPGGQALREVRGKQEAREEGEEEVVAVAGQGVAVAADAATAQENLQNTFVLAEQPQGRKRMHPIS